MARLANEDMARDRYDDIADPVSPYDTDGRVNDADFAHDLALGMDKSMTVLSQARKLGNTAVARLAELRAEMYEVQYFRPTLLTAIDSGMTKVRESELDDIEYAKHFERMALYIDFTQRRNAIRSELAELYEEHGEKNLVSNYDQLHRISIRERNQKLRAEVMIDTASYPPLQYASDPDTEHATVLRKELPETILTGMTSVATELLKRHGVMPNPNSPWGDQPKRLDTLINAMSEHIISHYHGTLGRVTIEEMPMPEEQKRAYILSGLAPRGINLESLKRLQISVLHKSLSKMDAVYGQSGLLIYVVFDEEKGDYVSCTRKMAGEWRENTESIERNADSIDRARILDAQGLINPTSAGLPTLGNHN